MTNQRQRLFKNFVCDIAPILARHRMPVNGIYAGTPQGIVGMILQDKFPCFRDLRHRI